MKVLTTGETAHHLGRSAEQVRRYEKSGQIQAIRTLRGYRLFRSEDVERLKEQLERKGRESGA